MSPTTPQDPIQAEAERLRSLQDKISLKEVTQAIDEGERDVNALPGKLAAIRAGGYKYKGQLEQQVSAITNRWRDARYRAQIEFKRLQSTLQTDAAAIQQMHGRHVAVGSGLNNLEIKIDSAITSLKAIYETVANESQKVLSQLDDVLWTVQQVSNASFTLLNGESPVEAAPANWKKPEDKDGVEGVLYLTDQRLLFEQREEVATKKMLFITTAKEKLQNLQWSVPVNQISSATPSKRGFMGKDDFLTITCSAGPFETANIHLRGESGETWIGFIERVRSGAINEELVGKTSGAPVQPTQPAPQPAGQGVGKFDKATWANPSPVLLRDPSSPKGTVGTRIRGNFSASVSDMSLFMGKGGADEARMLSFLRDKLNERLTDLLGSLTSGQGKPPRNLPGMIGEISSTLLTQAQPDFETVGLKLNDIRIDGIDFVD